jgi:hypothetical protein
MSSLTTLWASGYYLLARGLFGGPKKEGTNPSSWARKKRQSCLAVKHIIWHRDYYYNIIWMKMTVVDMQKKRSWKFKTLEGASQGCMSPCKLCEYFLLFAAISLVSKSRAWPLGCILSLNNKLWSWSQGTGETGARLPSQRSLRLLAFPISVDFSEVTF